MGYFILLQPVLVSTHIK